MKCPKCGFWADCNCYGELVAKIQEKIESLNQIQYKLDSKLNIYQIIEELKSLLEDK